MNFFIEKAILNLFFSISWTGPYDGERVNNTVLFVRDYESE